MRHRGIKFPQSEQFFMYCHSNQNECCCLAAITYCAVSTDRFSSYCFFACSLSKFHIFSSRFLPMTLCGTLTNVFFFPTGCYSGVPCSLKLLSFVLKLSRFSPSFMLLSFCGFFPQILPQFSIQTHFITASVTSSACRYLPFKFFPFAVVFFFFFQS